MMDSHDLNAIENRRLREYMFQYLEIITVISSVMLIRSKTKENLTKKKELWMYLKKNHPKMYKTLRHKKFIGVGINLPGKFGRDVSVLGYRIAQKIFGFN